MPNAIMLRPEHHPSTTWRGNRYHPPEELRAITHALHRVQTAHDAGRLLTPFEAMALAGPGAAGKDTLYSIARDTGWEDGIDVETILAELEHQFPNYC